MSLYEAVKEVIQRQNGVLFAAAPAFVSRDLYAGRGILAQNTEFTPSMTDERGYLPVEWWIMSKTGASNPLDKENEGITSLRVGDRSVPLPQVLEVAEKELMGEYNSQWPLTKVLDIGGPKCSPQYSNVSLSSNEEIPPIPCHIHAGYVVDGRCTGHGKTEAYFFPPVDVPPYDKHVIVQPVKTRLALQPHITKQQVVKALKEFGKCDDMYTLLNVYEIKPWETWTIEEKTIHAPGPWPTFEIQRPQDDCNLLAWQLGRKLDSNEVGKVKQDHQLRGLADEDSVVENTFNWEANVDSGFKDKWWRKCETVDEGSWGRKVRLFYHMFYGEGFIVSPGQSYTRQAEKRPFAGIVWSGEGTINGLPFSHSEEEHREFLVTPGHVVKLQNTSPNLDLYVFTVFPINSGT